MNCFEKRCNMIYADNAATTKISEIAYFNMLPFLQEQYGNASSHYSLGVKSKRAIENARTQVALAIGSKPNEITFTSGGSESNNWVLRGIAELFRGESSHIITSSVEHYSILNTCRALETMGLEITYVPVDRYGLVDVAHIKKAIKSNTKLVSIMLVNNEIGTIQPIEEIGNYLEDKDVLFHTDAVQAVGHIPVDVNQLKVDYLSASAHKFNGAKGVGLLFMRSGLELPNLIYGGKQEHGKRSGTENVAGIVAAGYAIEESVSTIPQSVEHLELLTNITLSEIRSKISDVSVNGSLENCMPGIVNLCFQTLSGEALLNVLDLKGICLSTGSACNSGGNKPSHVLLALGLSEKQIDSSIRISYGRFNTVQEAEEIAAAVCDVYSKIRCVSY